MEWTILVALVIVVIAIVAIGFVLVPWLKKKGVLNDESVKATQQMVQLIGLVLQNIQLDNTGIKDEVQLIFGICEKTVQYVEQTMKDSNSQDKKMFAMNAVVGILDKMKIELTDENKHLIEIGIEAAVNLLP